MRYWKTMGLVILIVLSFGVYYVQSAFGESNYPQVQLKTINGDPEVVKNIILMASLTDPTGNIKFFGGDQIRITNEDTTYWSELSYFEKLDGGFHDPIYARLHEQYRSFMRGKSVYGSLVETKEQLIHAGPFTIKNEDTFEIDMLDKDTKEKTSFKVPIPEKKYQYMNIVGVHVNEDQLSVITHNFNTPHIRQGASEGFHIYRISLEDQSLISHEAVFSDSESLFMSELNNNKVGETQEYFLMEVVEDDSMQVQYEQPKSTYYAYHYETGELVEIDLPEHVKNQQINMFVDGSILFIASFPYSESPVNKFEIIKYNLKDHKQDTMEITISLPILDYMNRFAVLNDGKMYIPSSSAEGSYLFVVDVKDGELVYEGELVADQNLKKSYLDIYNVFFN